MYCIECGTLVPDDAKFCSKCGKSISEGTSEKPNKYSSITADVARPRKLWLDIVGVLLVLTYIGMFSQVIVGRSIDSRSGPGIVFVNGLFFYLWWKWRARKGWHGALLGAALGFLAFTAAAFIIGLMTH